MRNRLLTVCQLALAILFTFAIFAPITVNASTYTVAEESDWYFTLTEDSQVIIYGNSDAGCNEFSTDPYLWLYDSDGTLIAQDDDSNHNTQDQCVSSKIYTTLVAGDYRIRAGYCCSIRGLGSNPYNDATYTLVLNFDAWTTTTTTTTTLSTSTTSTSTTTAPSTSITTSTSTTSTSSTTTSTTTSTTLPPTTTTSTTTTVPMTTTISTGPPSTTTTVEPPPPPPPPSPPLTTSTTTTVATTTSTTTTTTTTTTTVPPTTTSALTTSTVPPTTTTVTTTSEVPPSTSPPAPIPAAPATTDAPTPTTSTTTTSITPPTATTSTTVTLPPPPPNDAPLEEKQAFEEEVNIYANEGFDDYVPAGSTVDVATRRTITATSVIISGVPTVAARKRHR